MSSFKFSFKPDHNEEPKDNTISADQSKSEIKWLDALEISPSDNIINHVDKIFPKAKMILCGKLNIGHVYPEDGIKYLMDNENECDLGNNVISADCTHSDLVSGKYEGGMKIWECTMDLAEYLERENILFKDKVVMDLGCGAGILGIVALLNDSTVHFQDYNKEVIHSVTIPNCLLNIKEDERSSIRDKCKYFSGDWKSLTDLFSKSHSYNYDYILSSETIYNVDCYDKLCNFIINHLKQDGVAYVAAKTYYFGVGGGVKLFENFIKNLNKLNCEVCWKSSGGVVREILKITLK